MNKSMLYTIIPFVIGVILIACGWFVMFLDWNRLLKNSSPETWHYPKEELTHEQAKEVYDWYEAEKFKTVGLSTFFYENLPNHLKDLYEKKKREKWETQK